MEHQKIRRNSASSSASTDTVHSSVDDDDQERVHDQGMEVQSPPSPSFRYQLINTRDGSASADMASPTMQELIDDFLGNTQQHSGAG